MTRLAQEKNVERVKAREAKSQAEAARNAADTGARIRRTHALLCQG